MSGGGRYRPLVAEQTVVEKGGDMVGYLILAGVVGIGVILYFFSVMSRKTYKCPKCGERLVGVEYMSAKRCGMCGAPLEQQ
ncbi:MAG: hypothetical protein ACYSWO_09925 [Planctomycetota bacterium]